MDSNSCGVLEGYVSRCDPHGWLELTRFKYKDDKAVDQNVLVYVFEAGWADDGSLGPSLLGAYVVITEVHCIRLWNSLAGFTTGLRSVLSLSPQLRLKRARPEDMARPIAGTGAASSGRCITFKLWLALAAGRVCSGSGCEQLSEAALQAVLAAALRSVDLTLFDVPPAATGAASDFLFYVVRAGQDADWLCAQLPEVLNCRHVLRMAARLCRRVQQQGGEPSGCQAVLCRCGREHRAVELHFPACVVGRLAECDRATGRLVVTDSTGACVTAWVSENPNGVCPRAVAGAAVVLSEPLLLVEFAPGRPLTAVLLCAADRVRCVAAIGAATPDACDIGPSAKQQRALSEDAASPVSVPASVPMPAVSVSAVSVSAGAMSVRRALSTSPRALPIWGSGVEGIVLSKRVAPAGRAFENAAAAKYAVVLRDTAYGDTITAFVEVACAAAAVLGSVVCLRGCTLKVSKNQKSVYIEFDKRKGSTIVVTGVVSDLLLLHQICEASVDSARVSCCEGIGGTSTSRVEEWSRELADVGLLADAPGRPRGLTRCRHLPPPCTRLQRLDLAAAARGGISRCEWSCRGSISQVVSLQAYLRCDKCLSRVEPMLRAEGRLWAPAAVLACPKCSHGGVSIAWQMSLFFDDGTGECRLSADGELVFQLLAAVAAPAALRGTREAVEAAARELGTVRGYAFERRAALADAERGGPGGCFDEEMRSLAPRDIAKARRGQCVSDDGGCAGGGGRVCAGCGI